MTGYCVPTTAGRSEAYFSTVREASIEVVERQKQQPWLRRWWQTVCSHAKRNEVLNGDLNLLVGQVSNLDIHDWFSNLCKRMCRTHCWMLAWQRLSWAWTAIADHAFVDAHALKAK